MLTSSYLRPGADRSAGRRLVALVLATLMLTAVAALVPAAAAQADGACPLIAVGKDDAGEIIWGEVCPGAETEAPGSPADSGGGTVSEPTCDIDKVRNVADYPFCVGTTACAVNNPSHLDEDTWPEETRPSPEHIYTWLWCRTADGDVDYEWTWYLPEETGPSVFELAQIAFGSLAAPAFTVGHNPPAGGVVGVESWFWAAGPGDGAISASSMTVTAIGSPARLEVDPGDGSGIVTCPWSTSETGACGHVYGKASVEGSATVDGQPAYAARARLVYDVRFEQNGGALDLAGLPTTLESPWQTTAVPVVEIQSVTTR